MRLTEREWNLNRTHPQDRGDAPECSWCCGAEREHGSDCRALEWDEAQCQECSKFITREQAQLDRHFVCAECIELGCGYDVHPSASPSTLTKNGSKLAETDNAEGPST